MNNSFRSSFLDSPDQFADRARNDLRERLVTIECLYSKNASKFEHLFNFMAIDHESLGLIACYARNNISAFKQHWSLVSKLRVFAARHEPDSYNYLSGGSMNRESELLYAVISDNKIAISEAAALDTPRLIRYRDDAKSREFLFHLAQLIMRDDYESAQTKIEIGSKKPGGGKKNYSADTNFYSLLMRRDKSGLEASIMDCSKREEKTKMPIVCDFIRPVSTFRTKLCWCKGIPVEIEHPMVPMSWMPVRPLPRYDDIYNFLSPDWVPPERNIIANICRKFIRNYPNIDACMERILQIDIGNNGCDCETDNL